MADPLRVLISTPLVSNVDLTDLSERNVEVRIISYDLAAEERTLREQDPEGAIAAGEPTPLSEADLDAYAWAEALIAFDSPLNLADIAPNLQWVQTIGSGVSQYRASGFPSPQIQLTNAAGLAAAPIAEWVVGRILEVYKAFPAHEAQQRDHVWHHKFGRNVAGSTALIVGLGAIGRNTSSRLRAFGCNLIGVRNSYVEGMTDGDVDRLIGPADLEAALADADIVVVCANATDDNEGMFDAAMFDKMRDRALFINVARGTLVDEPALIGALESGKLSAAAIDVARNEPMPENDPLWDAPNLRISPHSSVAPDRYGERVLGLFLENLDNHESGQPLVRVVNL